MAMKKSTPPGNPGGRTSQKISSSVTVLGSKLPGYSMLQNPPRKALTPKQMDEAKALAAKLKAKEAKAAAYKKANAKIIKEQNKSASRQTTMDKIAKKGQLSTKKVIKVTPRGSGLRGGMGFGSGGGLRGNVNK